MHSNRKKDFKMYSEMFIMVNTLTIVFLEPSDF